MRPQSETDLPIYYWGSFARQKTRDVPAVPQVTIMIPPWNDQHVLPPMLSASGSHLPGNRTPYRAALLELVDRFAFNAERAEILSGFLEYRSALHAAGINRGLQWIGGSFVEHIERSASRTPNDIDVVSFYYPPEPDAGGYESLFGGSQTKTKFHVHAYGMRLGLAMNPGIVKLVGYWYGMWAHRRNGSPKGFVEIDLNPGPDSTARQALCLEIQTRGWI